jgi:hypothetical protein
MHQDKPRKPAVGARQDLWRPAGTCVDYQIFVRDLPYFEDGDWRSGVAGMRALGLCEDNACGVTTVRGEWGFFQIPARGFPELKVTLFQFTPKRQRRQLLNALANALDGSR